MWFQFSSVCSRGGNHAHCVIHCSWHNLGAFIWSRNVLTWLSVRLQRCIIIKNLKSALNTHRAVCGRLVRAIYLTQPKEFLDSIGASIASNQDQPLWQVVFRRAQSTQRTEIWGTKTRETFLIWPFLCISLTYGWQRCSFLWINAWKVGCDAFSYTSCYLLGFY